MSVSTPIEQPLLVSVVDIRGVKLATVTIERPLTILVGPNGSGKSTVLNQIRNQTLGRHIYIGPHRATRRQNARLRFMGGNMAGMADTMSAQNVNPVEGIMMSSHTRDPWELDEASNLLKYNLCKIEFQRNSTIANVLDRDGHVNAYNFPDLWEPLRNLTRNLLPHLSFSRVETLSFDNMRCLFKVGSTKTEVDFDDLSSGEKSIIQMLYPLIEVDIHENLDAIMQQSAHHVRKQYIIIDEPELHLHPSLQEKLVSYLRALAISNGLRVVLATHSPTIIDAADESDILLLRSQYSIGIGENQIVSLGSESDRLRVIQESVGSVFPATAARPVLLIEGSSTVKVKNYSDKQLYSILDPRFLSLNIVPGGGKEECLKALKASKVILAENPYGVGMYALLDRDLETVDQPAPGAFHLPVCMVENLCLNPSALFDALGPMQSASSFRSAQQIEQALQTICSNLRTQEAARRFRHKLRLSGFIPGRDVDTIEKAKSYQADFVEHIRSVDFESLMQCATDEVNQIIEAGTELQFFSGKEIYTAFWSMYIRELMHKPFFLYLAAQSVQRSGAYATFFNSLFGAIT